MIQINNISKSYSSQDLLVDASFIVGSGEKIGLIGRNGCGKSTLFRMIQGVEQPDTGDIIIPKNYRIGALEQHIKFTKDNVLDECLLSLSEEEQYDHYKAEKILSGLGFSEEDFKKDPYLFSGGYQVRISLTKALLKSPDLLLLDEPTNYLDIISIRWLKNFLKTYPSEIIMITHDRSFMDDVVTHVLGIKRGGTKKIKGSTAKYYEQIEQEEILHEQTRVNVEKKRKELQGFVDKFRASASKASQAQSKLKQLDKLESIDQLAADANMALRFHYSKCPSKTLATVTDISFSYTKESEILFKDINFTINREDRIAIIGKNGKGKSTLLNIIASELTPNTGEIKKHPNTMIGHFGQTNINRLDLESTIVDEIFSANTELTMTQTRSIAGSMLFTGDTADKKIKVLSGGERSRVLLGKILANPANLLLLDEPTNHLDIDSVQILTRELKKYPGAVVFVTHDEMMLREIATKIIVFRGHNAEVFHGTYSEFLEKIGWDEEENEQMQTPVKVQLSYKEKKNLRAELVKKKAADSKPFKTKIEKLEAKITQAEEELTTANASLIIASENSNGSDIEKFSVLIANLNESIEKNFDELELQSQKLTEVQNLYDEKLSYLD